MKDDEPGRVVGAARGLGLLGLTTLPAVIMLAPVGFWSAPRHWYELAAAVAAVGQAIFAGFVLEGLRQARRSADIALANFELARETSATQLRAYIGVCASVEATFKNGLPILQEVKLINSGNTPAKNLTVRGGWTMLPVDEELPDIPIDVKVRSLTDVGPGIEFTINYPAVLPGTVADHLLKAWRAGEAALHLVGVVTYTDVFDQPRETRFNYIAHAPVDGRLNRANHGNEST